MKEGNIANSKKRKLNTGIKTCSQIKPPHSSNQSAADGPVKCAFCHSFKITDVSYSKSTFLYLFIYFCWLINNYQKKKTFPIDAI